MQRSNRVVELESHSAPLITPEDESSPLARLRSATGAPLKVAILSDFVRVSYANGAVFQTRSLYRKLRQCGHQVTLIGPSDPEAHPSELVPGCIQLPSLPVKAYPGLYAPMPFDASLFDVDRWDFDVVFGQTTSLLIEFGLWLRKMKGIPLLCVNTTHLPSAYEGLLPDYLANKGVREGLTRCLLTPFERLFRDIYNESDGLVVLSEGLRDYWTTRGVNVPVHVIPRSPSVDVFEDTGGVDPYVPWLAQFGMVAHGPRLLCAGRHTREKEQDRVLAIFAKHILPEAPDAVLFLVGTGPDNARLRQLVRELGARERVVFTGEVPFKDMPGYYRHADLLVHTSRSETFGNVLGEALWCGTPVIAMADGMGASSQVKDHQNGRLIEQGPSADVDFAHAVLDLIKDPLTRKRLGREAARIARGSNSPRIIEELMANAFESARRHAAQTIPVPVMHGSLWPQLATTLKHSQRWAIVMGLICLSGGLNRPASTLGSGLHPSLSS